MATKLPAALRPPDRMVVREGRATYDLEVQAVAFDGAMHVLFTDGTQVAITDLLTPVEVVQ